MGHRALSSRLLCILPAICAAYGQDVLTGGYDNARTNARLNEALLTPATVSSGRFGKLFMLPTDGQVYAQPLYQSAVTITGRGIHNVVFTATMHNTVYAYDADEPGSPLWSVNLGLPIPAAAFDRSDGPYTDIGPEIGILGTPVIDASTGTIYLVAGALENGNVHYWLHALGTSDGRERFGAPTEIVAQVAGVGDSASNGIVPFVPGQHLQRPALLLLNGMVYVAFGSHADDSPYHGWLMAYVAANVRNQAAVFASTPNSGGGSIWQSGRGPAADSGGNIYLATSNGNSDEITDFSDSILRLNAPDLHLADWFAPSNVQVLDNTDNDLGACGPVVIPGTDLVIAGGKEGKVYLLNTVSLGRRSSDDAQIPQSFQATSPGIFNVALWNREDGSLLYVHGGNGPVAVYKLEGNSFGNAPVSQSLSQFSVPFQGMAISANGTRPDSGILWITTADSWPLPATGVVRAYKADDLSVELWNSRANGSDALGMFVKFANPTVANGKVYVPGGAGVAVYGLLRHETRVTDDGIPLMQAVVNAASYADGPIAPGEIISIYGENLGPDTPLIGTPDGNGQLSALLGGTQVTFNGVAAPLLYTSGKNVAAIVPSQIADATNVVVQASYRGRLSAVHNLQLTPTAPGVFSTNSSGTGAALLVNPDGSVDRSANPVEPGSAISVLVSGAGITSPASVTGGITRVASPLLASVSATVDGQPADVVSANSVAGQPAGLVRIDLRLPDGVSGKDAALLLTIGGRQTAPQVVVVSIGPKAKKASASHARETQPRTRSPNGN